MQHYINAFKSYVDFKGKVTRPQYWYFILFHVIVYILIGIIESVTGLRGDTGNAGMITNLYSLVTIVPFTAIGIRRLHDIGKSGWWILIGLVPIVGWIWLIVLYATPSKGGAMPTAPTMKKA